MFTPISICVRLIAAIQDVIGSNFTNIKPWAVVGKATDVESEITLMLSDGTGPAFAELKVACSADTHEPPVRHITVSAHMRQTETPDKNIDMISVEEIVNNYRKLAINVIAGMLLQPSREGISYTKTLEVRFTLLHEKVDIDVLSGRTYDFEMGVANKAIPYIEALVHIKEQLSLLSIKK